MTRNTGHIDGEEAEFAVAAHLVRQGCRVSYTHGLYKYDLVADKDDELLRVQVKKANQNNEKPWKYRLFTEQYQDGRSIFLLDMSLRKTRCSTWLSMKSGKTISE